MYHTWVTGRKMCHLHEKNRSVLVKWVTFGKMRTIIQYFWKNGHFLKNRSALRTCVGVRFLLLF